MLERIVGQITLALLSWLDRRIDRNSVAVDADPDRDSLSRAGTRIRDWLRGQQNGVRPGGQSDENGS